MAEERQVRMAAQLYDMRDKARRLLGDKYRSHMSNLGQILTITAERDKKSVIQVAIDVCKKRELIGMDLLLVMAAAVELTEPSKESGQSGVQVLSRWPSQSISPAPISPRGSPETGQKRDSWSFP